MTWLDERLFGWSRSAHRGTSAWGGGLSSLDTSRAASPDISDDEDGGDYDNVIAYLGVYTNSNGTPRTRSRSLRGSYADLQALKNKEAEQGLGSKSQSARQLAPPQLYAPVYRRRAATTTGRTFDEGQTHDAQGSESTEGSLEGSDSQPPRKSERERRSSLTDRVSVSKIGKVSPESTFKEVTDKLNGELEASRT